MMLSSTPDWSKRMTCPRGLMGSMSGGSSTGDAGLLVSVASTGTIEVCASVPDKTATISDRIAAPKIFCNTCLFIGLLYNSPAADGYPVKQTHKYEPGNGELFQKFLCDTLRQPVIALGSRNRAARHHCAGKSLKVVLLGGILRVVSETLLNVHAEPLPSLRVSICKRKNAAAVVAFGRGISPVTPFQA